MNAALSLWIKGMRILPYLDDWLLWAPSTRQAVQEIRLFLRHLQKLGFSVNAKKSHLIPTQTTTFIGMTLNSYMSASVLGTYDEHSAILGSLSPGCVFAVPGGPTTNRDINSCYSGDSPGFTPPQDALSRDRVHPGEWRLHPDVVQEIWLQFGRAEMDLFASEMTTHWIMWIMVRKDISVQYLGPGYTAYYMRSHLSLCNGRCNTG